MPIQQFIEDLPLWAAKKNSIADIQTFLSAMGSLEKKMKIIHVAGTNGKGSVCANLTQMLVDAGYRVGTFISPHLVRINERILINQVPIDDVKFSLAALKIKDLASTLCVQGLFHPTYFEFLFYTAIEAFADAKVDYCILETGLGGRLDVTNAISSPKLTIITSISFDHMQYLGETIEEIAKEKAGIIKPLVPLVFDDQCPAASKVIEKTASSYGIQTFALTEKKEVYFPLLPFFNADYKKDNAILSMMAMQLLCPSFSLESQLASLKKVQWKGRMQEIMADIFVDGAHNIGGVQAFIQATRTLCSSRQKKPILLFSTVADKNSQEMIENICDSLAPQKVWIPHLHTHRASDTLTLADWFQKYTKTSCEIVTCSSVVDAFQKALSSRQEDEILFCAGSLYLVGEILGECND